MKGCGRDGITVKKDEEMFVLGGAATWDVPES